MSTPVHHGGGLAAHAAVGREDQPALPGQPVAVLAAGLVAVIRCDAGHEVDEVGRISQQERHVLHRALGHHRA